MPHAAGTVIPPAQPPPLRIGLAYFGSALAFLLAGSVGLVRAAPDVAAGWFPLPLVVAVVHLFTLGWLTLSILASLLHFVPVVLHTRLLSERTAWLLLAAFDLGLGAFAAGELLGASAAAFGGAVLVAVALAAFAAALAAATLRVRPRGRTAHGLLAAALSLAGVLTLGVLLAGARALGWLGAARLDVLSLHLRLAFAGWVLLVLVAVGQRLLPMFLLVRAPNPRVAAASLALVAGGALLLPASYGRTGALAWASLAPSALGLVMFLAQAAELFRRSAQLRNDAGMQLAGAGLALLGLAVFMGWAVAVRGTAGAAAAAGSHVAVVVVAGGLLALSMVVAGHYYRLVPFLVWSARWARVPDPGAPRSPAGLVRRRAAETSLYLLAAGSVMMLAAFASRRDGLASAGALAFSAGAAVLAWQMAAVMAGRPAS